MTNKVYNILVVEDDLVDQKIIARSLKKINMKLNISFESNLTGGINALSREDYHCVFLDYLLPDGNGLELVETIRKTDQITPIIIVTSQSDENIAVEAMKKGASDYMTKSLYTSEGLRLALQNAVKTYEFEKLKENQQEKIQRSIEQLNEAQRLSQVGSWSASKGFKEIVWSDQMFEIVGVKKEKGALGPNEFLDRIHSDYREGFSNVFKSSFQNQTSFSFEIKIEREDKAVFCMCKGEPVYSKEGEIEGLSGTIQDISERKQYEELIIKSRKEALMHAQAKQEFLANMSHEIRTPLNAIIGFSNLLSKTKLFNDQSDYVKTISSSSNHLLTIINDILDYSKIESGKLEIRKVGFDIRKLLKDVVKTFSLKAHEKGVKLDLKIENEIPLYVLGDASRLNQILINLIGNSLKFTDKGKVEIVVECINEDNVHEFTFKVIDTGIGIPEKFLDSLFESFSQANNNYSKKHGGSGLGLAIVNQLVELQNGSIEVDSTEGEGACFTVMLKYEGLSKEAYFDLEKKFDVSEDDNLEGVKVLLVEDNVFNIKLASRVLEGFGSIVTIAVNGEVAIDRLKESDFDVVLMDLRMPVLDGYETTKIIRGELALNIPIIALTANAVKEEIDKCYDLGMQGCLTKPFDSKELKNTILRLLYVKHQEDTTKENSVIDSGDSIELDFTVLETTTEGDADFMVEMLKIFIEETPKELANLMAKIENKDWNGVKNAVHKMKAQSKVIGANDMFDKMDFVEQEIESNGYSSEIEPVLKFITDNMQGVVLSVNQKIQSLT